MIAWAVPTELQESTHPEIAILENYYEVGERVSLVGKGHCKCTDAEKGANDAKYNQLPRKQLLGIFG